MSQKYPGGFITKSPVAPTALVASGMWTIDQAMQLQKQGLWPSPPPTVIGQAFGGGYYAGQISTSANSVATHYLIVGPVSTAYSYPKQWKTANTTTAGTSSLIDGPANSAAMNNASHPAAQFCENLSIGGFTDWYMPAFNELEVCYYNLKPTTDSNNTGTGVNSNAVPARASNYTSGTPAQTSATAFQSGNAEAFTTGTAESKYWNSTEFDQFKGWQRIFTTGAQSTGTKDYDFQVRAIRRVAV